MLGSIDREETSKDSGRIIVLADRLLEIQKQIEIPVTPVHEKNMHRKATLSKVQRKINKALEAKP